MNLGFVLAIGSILYLMVERPLLFWLVIVPIVTLSVIGFFHKNRWFERQKALYLTEKSKAVHTYCEVAFDDSGRTYYYRTRNPELRVGDTVYVPFGYKAPKRIGVIVSMENFEGHDVPFPLERTKHIIGKIWKNPQWVDRTKKTRSSDSYSDGRWDVMGCLIWLLLLPIFVLADLVKRSK